MPDDAPAFPVAARWVDAAPSLRPAFERARPFPMLVLDEFLDPAFAHALLAEFPPIRTMPRSRDYIFAKKHQLASVASAGPVGARFHAMVISERFHRFMVEATGVDAF